MSKQTLHKLWPLCWFHPLLCGLQRHNVFVHVFEPKKKKNIKHRKEKVLAILRKHYGVLNSKCYCKDGFTENILKEQPTIEPDRPTFEWINDKTQLLIISLRILNKHSLMWYDDDFFTPTPFPPLREEICRHSEFLKWIVMEKLIFSFCYPVYKIQVSDVKMF